MQLTSNSLISLDRLAQLKPYKPRPFIEREFMTDAEIQASVGSTLFLNVESYSNVFLITFKLHKTEKFIQLECGKDKSFNSKFLSWIMHNYKTVGFNSIAYDLNVIWLSYLIQNTEVLKDATNDLILNNFRKKELQDKYKFQVYKTNHIDLINVAPLKGSLKLYGARLHTKSIQEQPFDINSYLTENEIEQLKQFNCNQLSITEELFNFMKERLELREAMGNEYREDLMSKSDAQIAEVVLTKEIGKINGQRPKRPEIAAKTIFRYIAPSYIQYQSSELKQMMDRLKNAKFIVNNYGKIDLPDALKRSVKIGKGEYRLGIGGLHSSETNVAYKATDALSIVDDDVISYYPKIVTTLGLYPISCGPAFLEAYNRVIDSRIAAKRAKRATESNGKKIVINGAGGKFSDFWSVLYSPDLTIQMTVTGQLALLLLIEILELSGIEVISANTDGIVKLVTKDKEDVLKRCIHFWEHQTGFETEQTRYAGYYARDVNSYFAVKLEGEIKKKGPWAEVGSQSGTKLDTNPIVLICSDAVDALLTHNIPIEQTILNCKNFTRFVTVRQAKAPGAHWKGEYLGKVLRWYYAKGETGCIQTVQANNKVADSDGARPCLDLPEIFPTDIDYAWYIRHTKQILEDIGYSPKLKQIEFF